MPYHYDPIALSIIMISIPERSAQFNALKQKVKNQIDECRRVHPALQRVEIVEVVTPKVIDGGPSIGAKRQQGLDKSLGKYVCWLDDDDDVSPDYVETILRLAYGSDADVLTFNNISLFDNMWVVVRMRLSQKKDQQIHPGIVNRRPYHVCAWKRELAVKVRFDDTNKDEDTAFISKLIPLCQTENKCENILHQYNRTTKSYAVEIENLRR